MKRIINFVLLFVLCTSGYCYADRSLDEIIQSGEIRFCYTRGVTLTDEQYVNGPEYDIAVAVVKELGLKPKLSWIVKWGRMFMSYENDTERHDYKNKIEFNPWLFECDECDVYAANITHNEDRARIMIFTLNFLSRNIVVVNEKDEDKYKSVLDLQGKTTAVNSSTTYEKWLLEQNEKYFINNPIKIIYPEDRQVINAVDKGIYDFVLLDIALALIAQKHRYNNLVLGFTVGPTDKIGWGLPKSSIKLRDIIQDIFEKWKVDGNSPVNLTFKKFFGVSYIEYNNRVFFTFERK